MDVDVVLRGVLGQRGKCGEGQDTEEGEGEGDLEKMKIHVLGFGVGEWIGRWVWRNGICPWLLFVGIEFWKIMLTLSSTTCTSGNLTVNLSNVFIC